MRRPEPPSLESLSSRDAKRVNAICNEFEDEWGRSARPSVRAYLERVGDAVDPAVRQVLLRELLTLERELRGKDAGEHDRDARRDLVRTPAEAAVVEFVLGTAAGAEAARRFRIRGVHASGGLGEVCTAIDEQLDRVVALKRMKEEHIDDASGRARFIREAEVTGRLEHPNIPPVYALGRDRDGQPFYAMRFIEGRSLEDHIRDRREVTPGDRRPAARERALRDLLGNFIAVCDAVAFAHSRGVLHRDIKPGNVMLGPFGETFLVDWGLARVSGAPASENAEDLGRGEASGPGLSVAGLVLGTLPYMSPEQAEGDQARLGPASDVYSLGATLYHLLTGRPPFAGSDADRIRHLVIRGEFRPPRNRDRSIPSALEGVVLKAMARQPGDRYESATAMAEDLKRWLADEPVAAHRESLLERSQRWIRKHDRLVIVSVIILFCIAVIVANRRARLQEVVAEVRVEAAALAERGRFGEAAGRFTRAIEELRRRPFLLVDPGPIVAQQDLYRNMQAFRDFSYEAWFYAGEERGDEALEACRAALACYGVLDRPDWARNLARSGLPGEMISTLKAEVHRILLLKAAMHLEAAILAHRRSDTTVVGTSSTDALDALRSARVLEDGRTIPFSRTATLLVTGALALPGLKDRGPRMEGAPSAGTKAAGTLLDGLTAEDSLFLGIMHVFLAKHPTDPFAETIRLMGPGAFDFAHPRDTAVAMLRRAVLLEPWQFWSNFMLGRILAAPDPRSGGADHAGALLAFNNCVSLRRNYSRGYEQRALTLALLSTDPAEAPNRESLRRDAVAELTTASRLAARDDASTHWVRGETYVLLGRTTEAIAAYTLALRGEKDLQSKVSRRNQVNGARELALRVLGERPDDPDAVQLLELCDRAYERRG